MLQPYLYLDHLEGRLPPKQDQVGSIRSQPTCCFELWDFTVYLVRKTDFLRAVLLCMLMDVTDKIVLGVLVDDARLYKTPVLYDLQSSPLLI